MKMQIIGFEASPVGAVSNKTGKAYDIGQIHAMVRLGSPLSGGVAKGFMGSTYRCTSEMVRSIAHLPTPFAADVDVQDVMRFGKREQEIFSIVPEKLLKAA